MRIISGKFGGRRFNPPSNNWPTRPTTDRARESLYNILRNTIDFSNIKMLDLFGGTGAHCFESISLGCLSTCYVDRNKGCVSFVRTVAHKLDVESCIDIVQKDVFNYISSCEDQFNLIIADPPYDLFRLAELPVLVFSTAMLIDDGVFVLEHDSRHDFSEDENFWKEKKYGHSRFSFFRANN